MARKALIIKANKKPKYKVRKYTRCYDCGRSRSVMRIDCGNICRIDFRKRVFQGLIPGFRKAS